MMSGHPRKAPVDRTDYVKGTAREHVRSDMHRQLSLPLNPRDQIWCRNCGAPIWQYHTNAGQPVTLENAPGPYVIDGRGKAYRASEGDGYRGHSDYCIPHVESQRTIDGLGDEFLWP